MSIPVEVKKIRPLHITSALIAITVLWGGSFVFNKIGFRDFPPLTFLFLRFSLATVIMGLFCIPRLPRLNVTIIQRGVLVGAALSAANFSFVLGLNETTASRAGFLNNLFVLIVPVVCYLLWRHAIDRWTIAGIGVALVGLAQLAGGTGGALSRGDVISIICAFFIAGHIVMVSQILGDEDVYLVTLVQFLTVSFFGAIAVLLSGSGIPATPGVASLGSLAYCAIFPTVVCFTLQNAFQRYTTPTQAGLIYTLDPVWSTLGGIFILGETLSIKEWQGCFLILAAIVIPLSVKWVRERSSSYGTLSEGSG